MEAPNSIDWQNDDHKRIVMARLVNAVYLIAKNKEEEATRWYETFYFERCLNLLNSPNDINGIVFKFNHSMAQKRHQSLEKAPLFVVALRGTQITNFRDLLDDLKIKFGTLRISDRVLKTVDHIQDFMMENKQTNNIRERLWWTGHSLGAAVATCSVVMIKQDYKEPTPQYVPPTFIFNPPFISTFSWPRKILNSVNLFERPSNLHQWIPNLFVNPYDLICRGYIAYFENGRHSLRLNDDRDCVKFLPSARLTNHHNANDSSWWSFIIFIPHRILQWRAVPPHMEGRDYIYEQGNNQDMHQQENNDTNYDCNCNSVIIFIWSYIKIIPHRILQWCDQRQMEGRDYIYEQGNNQERNNERIIARVNDGVGSPSCSNLLSSGHLVKNTSNDQSINGLNQLQQPNLELVREDDINNDVRFNPAI